MSLDLSVLTKKETADLNITQISYQDYSTLRHKTASRFLNTDIVKKLQFIFEEPIQNYETKKPLIDQEIKSTKEGLFNILDSIHALENDIAQYHQYQEKLKIEHEQSLIKAKSENLLKNDYNTQKNKKTMNKSSNNLAKVTNTNNNNKKVTPIKGKTNELNKSVILKNEKSKFDEKTIRTPPLTPVRSTNKLIPNNNFSKRSNNESKSPLEINNNPPEHSLKLNRSFIDKPSNIQHDKTPKSNKSSFPVLPREIKKEILSPIMKDKLNVSRLKDSVNKSIVEDEGKIKENLNDGIENNTIIKEKESTIKNKDCEELDFGKIENFDKIIHETSKKIELDINQYIVAGNIEEFALEKINIDNISELANTNGFSSSMISFKNINKSDF